MTETASTLDEMIGSECRHGFVTDLECDSVPRGLSEGTVRMISKKKGSVARGTHLNTRLSLSINQSRFINEHTMTYPAFFAQAPAIVMHDSLAQLLGAADDGMLTYHYLDAVKLAGHSCPTVAGAWLMTRRALQVLYPESIPERGAISVGFSASQEEGVAGVIASVVGLVSGAAGTGGFKGIAGQFSRQNLLHFSEDMQGEARFVRTDTGASVHMAMHMQHVAGDPRISELLRASLAGRASPEEKTEFASLWQQRVRRILIDHAEDQEMIAVLA